MADTEINKYINRRYNRWLDYAIYHCKRVGNKDCANEILNSVMLSVLEKDEHKINCMYNSIKDKKQQYRELDFFILRMIKLNIYSPTSPYQFKNKPIPNAGIDLRRLNIEDEVYEEFDRPAEILSQFKQVREVFEQLCLCEKAKRVFEHRFFLDLPFSEWQGTESKKELYEIYKKTAKLIKMKINKKCLI